MKSEVQLILQSEQMEWQKQHELEDFKSLTLNSKHRYFTQTLCNVSLW